MKIEIWKSSSLIYVRAPYNRHFVANAKSLGGKWTENTWVFDVRDEQRVRGLCMEWYGSDGITTDWVTIRVTLGPSDYGDAAPVEIYGRTIARAVGRDSGATLGDGVVLLQGKFTSGGSMKNWTTKVAPDTVVLVRDFPRTIALKLIDDPDWTVQIEEEAPVIDYAKLRDERALLVKRLEEIDALLLKEGQ